MILDKSELSIIIEIHVVEVNGKPFSKEGGSDLSQARRRRGIEVDWELERMGGNCEVVRIGVCKRGFRSEGLERVIGVGGCKRSGRGEGFAANDAVAAIREDRFDALVSHKLPLSENASVVSTVVSASQRPRTGSS
jgi:hypothetical protein